VSGLMYDRLSFAYYNHSCCDFLTPRSFLNFDDIYKKKTDEIKFESELKRTKWLEDEMYFPFISLNMPIHQNKITNSKEQSRSC
jgi:hypothetical protein